MEPNSPEQKDLKKDNEEILAPEIIRPLGRALQQRFLSDMKAVQKSAAKDEFEKKLSDLQTKEVKIVGGNNPDFPTWGIKCFGEEQNVVIPRSTTIIKKNLMDKLGPALQDYLINSAVAAKLPRSIIDFIRAMTHTPETIINNTQNESVFAGSLAKKYNLHLPTP